MTLRLWLADMAKGTAVGALIGLPLAALILWIMGASGGLWWLWAWVRLGGLQPRAAGAVPDGHRAAVQQVRAAGRRALKARVQALMQRCGFAAKGLFVMDGSRRSAHANAYFTGLGAAKRVVFFDTCCSG
jgi:STE24 endopeptidase